MAKIIIGSKHDAERKVIARRIVKIMAHEEKPFDSTLFKVPEGETPQLIVHTVSQSVYESRNAKKYTCTLCRSQLECDYAFDSYNTDGDCLAIK
jgi:hypothetical protein